MCMRLRQIDLIVAQQETLKASGSSLVALHSAISYKAVFKTLRKLYDATIVSITASTFETAGRITMAM
jgi:threonine synthase